VRAASEGFGREKGGKPDRLADTQILVSYRGTDWVRDDTDGIDAAGPAAGDRAPDVCALRRRNVGFPVCLFDILRGTEHVLLVHLAHTGAHADMTALAAFAREAAGRFGSPLRVAVIALRSITIPRMHSRPPMARRKPPCSCVPTVMSAGTGRHGAIRAWSRT
jgi:hypothetical protein